ncbi:MAG: amylo-alpha-1,6-glucosidase [Bacteroidetes Order II. Incertae sedis bacterium]|nr:amylo-alpha-1,6-glucosidase [Bacteroidetes Order II. bacterium]
MKRFFLWLFLTSFTPVIAWAQSHTGFVPRFDLPRSGPSLQRTIQNSAFMGVMGRKSAAFGYENKPLEMWVYPLKLVHDFKLDFITEYEETQVPVSGSEAVTSIEVRPESTILTYRHAAFLVRQIIFAPVHEPGLVMLLDIDSPRPLTIRGSFRPALSLMWPAGLQTGNIFWQPDQQRYGIVEELGKYVGIVSVPGAQDRSIIPYQEEPRDTPNTFEIRVLPETHRGHFIPLFISGGTDGWQVAEENLKRLQANPKALYEQTTAYYKTFLSQTTSIQTPDERLNAAYTWAKIGTEKGVVDNPQLGTGLVAGFRTSGNSERPGFAWFFGRDSQWTELAMLSYGDFETVKRGLNFLKKFQFEDGRIPHEISQSAGLIDWFGKYPFGKASADATPLYVILHHAYYQATGDLAFIRENWHSIKKAWEWTSKTDTDQNGLIENTNFGHGWVEGGKLYPPHEEMYMQGLWIEACKGMAKFANIMYEPQLADQASDWVRRTQEAMEKTYWLPEKQYYGYATSKPAEKEKTFVPDGLMPTNRETDARGFMQESTVLPAVPMWFRTTEPDRTQKALDEIGSGRLATDWGHRILNSQSPIYDPMSYHYGSVWPLFTGWASLAGYNYGRPHIGYQALMANALLTFQDAYGYVTELLSGDYNSAFGRSSHHQIWSEAMVISPLVRGLFGIEALNGGKTLAFSPQVPADWDQYSIKQLRIGEDWVNINANRSPNRDQYNFSGQTKGTEVRFEPVYPNNAKIKSVLVNGKAATFKTEPFGDGQKVVIPIFTVDKSEVLIQHEAGAGVYVRQTEAPLGGKNTQVKVLRAKTEGKVLTLLVEGLAGTQQSVFVRGTLSPTATNGVTIDKLSNGDHEVQINFTGKQDSFIRQTIRLPLR